VRQAKPAKSAGDTGTIAIFLVNLSAGNPAQRGKFKCLPSIS
jgi:hypothetical protein